MKRYIGLFILLVLTFFTGFFVSYLILEGKLGKKIERLLLREERIEGRGESSKRERDLKKEEIIGLPVKSEEVKKGKEKEVKEKERKEVVITPSFKVKGGPYYVSIIIDDIGGSVEKAKLFAELPIDITLSIIPYLPHSKDCAKLVLSKNKSYMIHIPMEANAFSYEVIDIQKNTKNLLRVNMKDDEIKALTEDMINSLQDAVSANNHMGSLFTASKDKMIVVLDVLKKHNLFFVDSLTTPESKVCEAAKEVGIVIFKRNVFLDNVRNVKAIKERIKLLINTAKMRGYAIAIGHPFDATYIAIRDMIPYMEREGVVVVSIDKLRKIVAGGKDEGCF
ncbi:MAG: divergent polysaccharide deacetylase family protein [Thermosulfidibacteraceae bacterium]